MGILSAIAGRVAKRGKSRRKNPRVERRSRMLVNGSPARLVDVSMGGCAFRPSEGTYSRGDSVEVEIFGSYGHSAKMSAKVANADNDAVVVGVIFTQMGPQDKEFLAALVERGSLSDT